MFEGKLLEPSKSRIFRKKFSRVGSLAPRLAGGKWLT